MTCLALHNNFTLISLTREALINIYVIHMKIKQILWEDAKFYYYCIRSYVQYTFFLDMLNLLSHQSAVLRLPLCD